jgi:hypothetical protein
MRGKKMLAAEFIGSNIIKTLVNSNEVTRIDLFEYSDRNNIYDIQNSINVIEGDESKSGTFKKVLIGVGYYSILVHRTCLSL